MFGFKLWCHKLPRVKDFLLSFRCLLNSSMDRNNTLTRGSEKKTVSWIDVINTAFKTKIGPFCKCGVNALQHEYVSLIITFISGQWEHMYSENDPATAGYWTQGPLLWVTVLSTGSPTGWLVATHSHPSWVQTNNSSSLHPIRTYKVLFDVAGWWAKLPFSLSEWQKKAHAWWARSMSLRSTKYWWHVTFSHFLEETEMLLETLHSTPLGTFCLALVKVQHGTSSAQIFLYEDWQLYSAGTLNPRASLPDWKGHLLCQHEMQDKTSISDELGAVSANSEQRGNKHPCSLAVQQTCQVDLFWMTDGFLANFIIQLSTLQLSNF